VQSKRVGFSQSSFGSGGRSGGNPVSIGRLADLTGLTSYFAFHDNEEIGPRMLARIAKKTGLKPEDL
jgi:hypothetical protein